MTVTLFSVLILVLVAEFVNGRNDAPNAIATVVSTRVMRPAQALVMAAILNVLGALITGTAVAYTVGEGIVKSDAIGLPVIAAAVLAVATWGTIASAKGLPTSISHGLFSGLAGAALVAAGSQSLLWTGWEKIFIGMGFSTVLGFSLAFTIMTALYWILRKTSPSTVRHLFSRLQIISAAFMAFSHGSNDGQKFMGIFALALLLGGITTEFTIPIWVIILCGTVMGLGTAIGGWRIIKTMGCGLTKLEPVQGFAAETAAATVIQIASFMGVPISTTHSISTSIMGVGATRRLSAVRWTVAGNIVTAWIVTFPICGILGALYALIFDFIF